MFKITGNHEGYEHKDVLHKLIKQYVPHAQQKMGFDKPVDINLLSDPENARNPLGKTAFYDPNIMKITLFIDGRHVKDILRSLSHEMVHHTQNCQGLFGDGINTSPGYAQEDGDLRKMEKQAYLEGQMILRDWEDGIKQQQENKQMKNKDLINEIIEIIDEKIAELEETDKGVLDEVEDEIRESEEVIPYVSKADLKKRKKKTDEKAAALKKAAKEKAAKEKDPEKSRKIVDDLARTLKGLKDQLPEGVLDENWFKGNKDQLLFERLMEKWTKKR